MLPKRVEEDWRLPQRNRINSKNMPPNSPESSDSIPPARCQCCPGPSSVMFVHFSVINQKSFKIIIVMPTPFLSNVQVTKRVAMLCSTQQNNSLVIKSHITQEYIRVLVCNGKDQIQAKDDLEAFLGERSGAFVSWLWGQLFCYAHACKDASPSISDADVVLKSNRSHKVHSHGNPSAGCILTKNCHNIQKNSRDELPVFTENSKNHLEQLQKDRTGSRKAVDIAEKHGADSLRLSAIATERAKCFERADIHELVHFAVTKEALSSHFATCGLVSAVTFTDNVKGSAYITFASKDSVEKAWTLNGISFMSRPLKVVRKGEETTPATSKPPLSAAKSEKHPQKPVPKLGKTGLEKLLTFPEFIIISNGEGVPFMLHPKHQNLELLN